MSTLALVVAVAALVAGAVLFVAWPFATPGAEPPEEALSEADRRRLELYERRDEAYQALRDLEQELHTGKVTPADFEVERARLRGEAGQALTELDELGSGDMREEDQWPV
jgi:hypothetical protein